MEGKIIINDEEALKEALKNTAEDLAYKVKWHTEADYHQKAMQGLANEQLIKILKEANSGS